MIVTVYIAHEKRLSILQNSILHSTSNRTYQHSYAAVQLITDREPWSITGYWYAACASDGNLPT